jgi:hypothetical protein
MGVRHALCLAPSLSTQEDRMDGSIFGKNKDVLDSGGDWR